MEEHPLPKMLELGLVATVNSDDPAYFGGGIDANLAALRTTLGMTDDDLAVLATNSFEAAFADETDRARWLAEVAAWRP
jgi:adenosine deaminase